MWKRFQNSRAKKELMGMLLSVWTAPARYFVTGLDNLRKAKEEKLRACDGFNLKKCEGLDYGNFKRNKC